MQLSSVQDLGWLFIYKLGILKANNYKDPYFMECHTAQQKN